MKITSQVWLNQSANRPNNLANGNITLDDAFVVSGVSVMKGSKGIFVTLPQYKSRDGTYHDQAFPLTADLRKEINNAVLTAYNAELQKVQQAEASQPVDPSQPIEPPQEEDFELEF